MDDPGESLSHREESAKMLSGIRAQASETNYLRHRPKPGASGPHEPPSGGPHIAGAPATPIAALSGSTPKSPGLCRGIITCTLESSSGTNNQRNIRIFLEARQLS
jgi:hypothetical protein